jgi:hypothetical protein
MFKRSLPRVTIPSNRRKGSHKRGVSKTLSEHFISCSKSMVLECGCGEKLLLLGGEEDWRKEERLVFECDGCGGKLFLLNDIQ